MRVLNHKTDLFEFVCITINNFGGNKKSAASH